MESVEAAKGVSETPSSGIQEEACSPLLTPSDPPSSSPGEEPESGKFRPSDVRPKGKASRVSFKSDLEEEIWIDDPILDSGRDNDDETLRYRFESMEEVPLLSNGKKSIDANKNVIDNQNVGAAAADKPVEVPIEVEKKFIISNDTEDKIRNLGGQFLKEAVYVDCYFDTSDYLLTLNDCWLRKRNGKWQLKYPPKDRKKGASSSQYCETDSEQLIVAELVKKLQLEDSSDSSSLTSKSVEEFVSEFCEKFATLETLRKTYTLEGAIIDLDYLDFGFQVGEIEVVISNRNELLDALNKIDYLALRLGCPGVQAEGKLEYYLRTRRLSLYQQLLASGVLSECRHRHPPTATPPSEI